MNILHRVQFSFSIVHMSYTVLIYHYIVITKAATIKLHRLDTSDRG